MNIVTRHPKFFWALIAFLVLGSLWEMYPLTNQSLILEFRDQADRAAVDATFGSIVSNARGCRPPCRTRRANSRI